MRPARCSMLLSAFAWASCATAPADAGFGEVQRLTALHTQHDVHWYRGSAQGEARERELRQLLAAPLSADAAVRIALLENRELQASFERLGLARADLLEAGRLSNPTLAASARFPDRAPSGTNLELGLFQDLLDLLLRPARQDIAGTQLEETELCVAAEVVDFVARVRGAYYAALGAKQVSAMRKLVVDAALASVELARRIHEAGNLSDLQLTNEIGSYESARVAWARAEAERLATREELTRMLGLWGPDAAWRLPEGLPEIPAEELPLGSLEADAVARRLDLAAARKHAEALAQALGVTRDWRFLGMAEVGVSAEREPEGQSVIGPELSLELPLFHQRQAEVERLAAELRRADDQVLSLAVTVRSEVRAARDRLLAARALARHYREVVIPVREAAVGLTQEEYNYMLVGAFELIAAKQAEYDAYQEYVESVRDYWMARTDLERAVGGGLGGSAPLPSTTPEPGSEPVTEPPLDDLPADHHHH